MSDKEIGKALIHLDTRASAGAPDPRRLAAKVLRRDRWRVGLLTGLTVLLWLVAAAGVFFVIYVATRFYPKQQQLMQDATLGLLPAEEVAQKQEVFFQALEICTRVIAAAFVALTLAALCTVLLVLVSRRATLRQINASLAEISEQLKQNGMPRPTDCPDPPAAPTKGNSRRLNVMWIWLLTALVISLLGLWWRASADVELPADPALLFTLKGHSREVNKVAFSPDGTRIASAGGDGDATVKVWDSQTAQLLLTLKGHGRGVYNLAFSPDGKYLASAGHDCTVRIWDAETGEPVRTLEGLEIHVGGVAFSPDSKLLVSADGYAVKVWLVETGREVLNLKGHKKGAAGVAFSPDGKRVAAGGSDRTVRVWDATSGQELLTFKGHNRQAWGVAFSPDGQRIASASLDHTVKVWDAASGKEAFTFNGHAEKVWGVAFSPDGKRLASAGSDWMVRVWDAANGKEMLALKGHGGAVTGAAFSPDGKRLASCGNDRTVKVWKLVD